MKKIIGYLCAFLCILTQTMCINCTEFDGRSNIKIDSTYVHYKEHIDRLDKSEENRKKLAEQFLEFCDFGKESFINDITEAVHKISKTNVGIELLYILIDKMVDEDRKIKFIKMPFSGFSEKSSQAYKNELVMWLNEDNPQKMSFDIFDRNASITRQADFPEILFHELCHVMHYMFVGYKRYKDKHCSSTTIETIFNFKNFTVWPNDEELYTVT